jgi:hypothetical protein
MWNIRREKNLTLNEKGGSAFDHKGYLERSQGKKSTTHDRKMHTSVPQATRRAKRRAQLWT